MRVGFMDSLDDVQWLLETHLRGVPLPTKYAGFKSYVLQGNEDSPYAVNLYESDDPDYDDNYYRVRLINDSGAYAEACEYNGKTNKPFGGLLELI